jgi:hypothetical protein
LQIRAFAWIRNLTTTVLAFTALAHAQTSRGTVTGTVLDPSGAVVPGARLILTGTETGLRLPTESNEAGVYRFDAVDPGVYGLTVAHPGFKSYVAIGIAVEATRVTTHDPYLEVGAAEASVEVSGESSAILTKDSPLRGGNFQSRELRDLPLVSSNPLSLARMLPGATEASGSQVWSNVASPGAGFAINGQRPRGNNYMLDGTENNWGVPTFRRACGFVAPGMSGVLGPSASSGAGRGAQAQQCGFCRCPTPAPHSRVPRQTPHVGVC